MPDTTDHIIEPEDLPAGRRAHLTVRARDIREWARSCGYPLCETGRLSQPIIDAYYRSRGTTYGNNGSGT